MYFGDDKIGEIRAASDIVDVVSDYVRLKKRGANFFGLCPFHQEKSPSFSVNPSMGIYKCFGCGVGGDVISFVQEVEGATFPEAIRLLAEKAGVALPENEAQAERASETEAIYHALRFAARFFYQQLTKSNAGTPALTYLEGRGFSPQTIKQFGLGYAPDAWDTLLTAATEAQYSPEVLERAGLVIPRKSGDGYYDRYRGRVIFPIFSHTGRVLGFGGRILDASSDQPKYINSPETEVYHKSNVLYGLFQGKQAIRQAEEALLVEGYTDVVALHQAGVANAVAVSGTALTPEQVKLLGRFARRVLLLYDADAAGATATLRGIDLILHQKDLAVSVIALPAGEDPDSYVREHGAEAFRDYLKQHRQSFVQYQHAQAQRDGLLDTPEGKAEAVRRVVAAIARIPDEVAQNEYLRVASETFGIIDAVLYRALGEAQQAQRENASRGPDRPRPSAPRPEPPPEFVAGPNVPDAATPPPARPDDDRERRLRPVLPQEKILLRLMLERGTPMIEFILGNMSVEEFTPGPARSAVEELLRRYEAGSVDAQPFLDGTLGAQVQRLATEVLMDLHEPSAKWQEKNIPVPKINERPDDAAASAMTILKKIRIKEAIDALRAQQNQVRGDDDAQHELMLQVMQLKELEKQISPATFLDAA